ncbi:hypothetical protein P3T25_006354 [Paraburkholderia sp. GAS32]
MIASMTPVNVVMKMPAMRAASQEDHQRIFAAIMGRDPAAARDAMQAHLARVVGEFTQAWREACAPFTLDVARLLNVPFACSFRTTQFFIFDAEFIFAVI